MAVPVPVPVQDPLVQLEGAGAARARRPRARGVVDGNADGDDEGVRGDEHRREDERRDEAAAADGRHDVAGAAGDEWVSESAQQHATTKSPQSKSSSSSIRPAVRALRTLLQAEVAAS